MERRRLVVGVDTNKGKSGKYKERHNCVVNQEINSVNSLPGGVQACPPYNFGRRGWVNTKNYLFSDLQYD